MEVFNSPNETYLQIHTLNHELTCVKYFNFKSEINMHRKATLSDWSYDFLY